MLLQLSCWNFPFPEYMPHLIRCTIPVSKLTWALNYKLNHFTLTSFGFTTTTTTFIIVVVLRRSPLNPNKDDCPTQLEELSSVLPTSPSGSQNNFNSLNLQIVCLINVHDSLFSIPWMIRNSLVLYALPRPPAAGVVVKLSSEYLGQQSSEQHSSTHHGYRRVILPHNKSFRRAGISWWSCVLLSLLSSLRLLVVDLS